MTDKLQDLYQRRKAFEMYITDTLASYLPREIEDEMDDRWKIYHN